MDGLASKLCPFQSLRNPHFTSADRLGLRADPYRHAVASFNILC